MELWFMADLAPAGANRGVEVTTKEAELMQEIVDCQNCVHEDQYDPEDEMLLKDLRKRGLVCLAWQVTIKGMKCLPGEVAK